MKAKYRLVIICLLVLVGLLAILETTPLGPAKIIIVDDDGGGDYLTIQEAIDNASEDDTVLVEPGFYNESLVINKTLRLEGREGQQPVVDGGFRWNQDPVLIEAENVTVTGFLFQNSDHGGIRVKANRSLIEANEFQMCTVGIYLRDSFESTIRDNLLDSNEYGIYLSYSEQTLVTKNRIFEGRSAISLTTAVNNIIRENILFNNTSNIKLYSSEKNLIEQNIVEKGNVGVGHYEYSKENIVDSNRFLDCERGVSLSHSLSPVVRNNTFSGCEYAIWLYTTRNCSVVENTIFCSAEGVVLRDDAENITLKNNYFQVSGYAVNTTGNSDHPVGARNNFWGHRTGPYHPVNNSEGTGGEITDNVVFEPWLRFPAGYTKPHPAITPQLPGVLLAPASVTFNYSLDHDAEIVAYVWKLDGDELKNGSDPVLSLDFQETGNYEISLRMLDSYGFWSLETILQIEVHFRPEATILGVTPNPGFNNEVVTFSGEGSDDGEVLSFVWHSSMDGELYNGSEDSFSLSGLGIGTHEVTFMVQDDHGVWSRKVGSSLTIEQYIPPNKLPEVSMDDPGEPLKGTVKFTGTASDMDGDVEKVDISIAAGSWQTASGEEQWSYQFDTTTLEDGEYEIKARSYDGTNFSEEASLIVTVKNEKDKDGDSSGFQVFIMIPAIIFVSFLLRRHRLC